jgi:hypothetical protein
METSQGREAAPIIRRARGFRLYDSQGRRYLDLYREGGGALLGHRSAVTVMKSVLSQGLVSGIPSVWEARLVRAAASLIPGHRRVVLYSSRQRALEAISNAIGMRVDPSDLLDPALSEMPSVRPRACLWRPFIAGERRFEDCPAVLAVLPLTVCGAPSPVCFSDFPGELPPSEPLPGFLLAGAFSALVRLGKCGRFAEDPMVVKAVDGSAAWARKGPYIRATFSADEYPRVFGEFLRAGVLLSPAYPGPSILPGECSPGEARLLAGLFARIPGG